MPGLAYPTNLLKAPPMRKYQISVQRLAQGGRWREVGQWMVMTVETASEQSAMLNVGMREGWRCLVREVGSQAQAQGK